VSHSGKQDYGNQRIGNAFGGRRLQQGQPRTQCRQYREDSVLRSDETVERGKRKIKPAVMSVFFMEMTEFLFSKNIFLFSALLKNCLWKA